MATLRKSQRYGLIKGHVLQDFGDAGGPWREGALNQRGGAGALRDSQASVGGGLRRPATSLTVEL